MMTRLRNLWDDLLASYWFIPAAMSLSVASVALLVLRYDATVNTGDSYFWREWLGVNTSEGARQLLATIAGSTITLAGVIFSITVLALSFASANYGPRLLRNFMRDRASQIVLGAFVSAYVYSLLVLRTIGEESGANRIPHTAIGGALVLSLVNAGLLIFFIHHVARSIQASSVIATVGRDLQELIQSHIAGQSASTTSPTSEEPAGESRREICVESTKHGFVQAMALETLAEMADSTGAVIQMEVAPGDFVFNGMVLAKAWVRAPDQDEHVISVVDESVVVGQDRTNEQDLEFPIDQLAEIAVRALSPGTNDPFTAIYCINELGAALHELVRHDWPTSNLKNKKGRVIVRLIPKTPTRLLARSFDQILHYGAANPAVLRQVLKFLAHASQHARPQHRSAILRYADTTFRRMDAELDGDRRQQIIAFHAAIQSRCSNRAE